MNVPDATRFDDLAGAYAAYRIGYAPEIYDLVVAAGDLRAESRVVDLGCGTGLVAEQFALRGCAVTGVDVSEPMLARARERVPGATFVLGSAEAIPLGDASADALVCAQAFHWFDAERALAEAVRVVRPGGLVAVWWKGLARGDAYRATRRDVELAVGLPEVPDLLTPGFPAFERSALVERHMRIVPWNVVRTVEQLLGYEDSRARSREAYGPRYDDFLARLRERLGPADGHYTLGYVHHLYLGRVAA